MKVNVIENKDRKTITVIFGGVRFYSAKYLLERYNGERYFGNGILPFNKDEMNEVVKKIVESLNLANPEVKVSAFHLVEGERTPYPLFKAHRNKDDEWDGTFEVSLSVISKKSDRYLFFNDLARTSPVTNEQVIKEYEWGVELEISSKLDEETLDLKLYTVLHRIIKGKKAKNAYMTNDDAWGGFDINVDKEEDEKDEKYDIQKDDLPFA